MSIPTAWSIGNMSKQSDSIFYYYICPKDHGHEEEVWASLGGRNSLTWLRLMEPWIDVVS